MSIDERVIGQSWVIEPPAHVGHTITVEKRDEVDKHKAFWLRCSCGATTLMGEAWIEDAVKDEWTPHQQEDARFRARPSRATVQR